MPEYLAPFTPLPWQVAPWQDTTPVLLLTGSAGGGKSRLAAEKIHGYCLAYPGATWLMLRKAREWCRHSLIPFYQQSVVGNDPRVTLNRSEGVFHYANGSAVYTGGMLGDQQREAVRSIGGAGGLDGAWLEEGSAFTLRDYHEVLARIRHTAAPWRQVIITTNPDAPAHWINTELITGNGAAVYYSHATDNTHNAGDYLDNLNRLTGVLRQRLVEGQWVQAEGVVYDTFTLERHVTTRNPSQMARWYLTVDEGYTNPCAILLVGEDNDGRLHVANELYRAGLLQHEVVNRVRVWYEQHRVSEVYVDAAAAGLIAALQHAGVRAQPAKGVVFDGIQLVQNRLALAGDGRPRLTVGPDCENLIAEFQTYAWNDKRADVPLKTDDHALDALRYLVWSRDHQPHHAPAGEIITEPFYRRHR